MKFRTLRADEIDVRVGGKAGEDKHYFLLYKDARCDMNILDEQVGSENWQRRHYEVKGNLYCSVGIYDKDKKEWIWKDDCGTESQTEKEKGESSDSFKRACVNHGIGRELYTAPCIAIEDKNLKWDEDRRKLYTKLRVKDIAYSEDGRQIIRLCISDSYGNDYYQFGYGSTKKKEEATVCEKCDKPIVAVFDNDGKLIPSDEVIKTSQEFTKKANLGEHIYCPDCLKKVLSDNKKKLKAQMERQKNGE